MRLARQTRLRCVISPFNLGCTVRQSVLRYNLPVTCLQYFSLFPWCFREEIGHYDNSVSRNSVNRLPKCFIISK